MEWNQSLHLLSYVFLDFFLLGSTLARKLKFVEDELKN
jgi:hypothetical protein